MRRLEHIHRHIEEEYDKIHIRFIISYVILNIIFVILLTCIFLHY